MRFRQRFDVLCWGMDLSQILRQNFQIEAFRPGQEETLKAVLSGQNALTIMPTGGGKSLIYQLLAQTLAEGEMVLVISPLVALIDDQYDQAKSLGIKVGKVHSGMSSHHRDQFFQNLSSMSLVFMTPERLMQERTWEALSQTHVKYLAIDEAHCLSQWGHDFRPDYTRIPEYRVRMGHPILLALTATATVRVKNEILQVLDPKKSEDWFEFQSPVFRSNLNLQVYSSHGNEDKLRRIMFWASNVEGAKIIYFSLVQTLEKVSEQLQKLGVVHTRYHGQLPSHVKLRNQKNFFKGEPSLILATPAFGLGVNKADIRAVVHYELPQSIEAYFQEVGRAGRDGKKSWAEVLYDPDDVSIHMDFLKWNHPEPEFIYSLYQYIKDYPTRYLQEGADFLREKLNFYNKRDFRVETAINLLKRWDLLFETSTDIQTQQTSDLKRIPDMDQALYEKRKKSAQLRLLDLVQLLEKHKTELEPQIKSDEIQKEIVDYFLQGEK